MSEYFSSIIYSINDKKYLLLRGSEDLESLNFVIVGEPEQPSDFAGWSVLYDYLSCHTHLTKESYQQ